MANELTITNLLKYAGAGRPQEFNLGGKVVSLTTDKFNHHLHSVGTTEEAMDLGELATIAWCWIKNHDGTNFVELRTATAGTKFAKLLAGEAALFRFGSGVTAPYLIADTAACLVEYIIFAV